MGVYDDDFGNYINTNNCKINICLKHLFNYSKLSIGNKNFFNKTILIICHSYTKTKIGNYSIFASEVVIINGDGHSIFDVITGERVKDMRKYNNIIKFMIVFGYMEGQCF